MDLKEKIQKDLKESIKQRDERRTSVLRMLLFAIKEKEIERRKNLWNQHKNLLPEELEKESRLKEDEILKVILSEVKKRKEAVLEFERGRRKDLAEKEKEEIKILEDYLPEQMSPEEIKKLAQEVIKKVKAKDLKDIGKVMKEIIPRVKGRADGSLVSQIVKDLLSS